MRVSNRGFRVHRIVLGFSLLMIRLASEFALGSIWSIRFVGLSSSCRDEFIGRSPRGLRTE